MASRILKMIAQSRSAPLNCASISTRRYASTKTLRLSPFPELDSLMVDLSDSLSRKVAGIQTTFVSPEIHESTYLGAGVCIDPTFIVTSVRVVARVAPIRDSGGSTRYRAYIGSTAGAPLNRDTEYAVKMKPVAVSFARDIAVLKVVEIEGEKNPLPVCPVAASPQEKESLLMALTRNEEDGWGISSANVRAVGKKTIKAKAPWPLDDGLEWLEHDWLAFYRGPPPPSSVLFSSEDKVTGTITKLSGSPWFNLYGEFVGIASWVLRDDPANISVGYVSPLSNIWPVVDYAKTKGPQDPVVMDTWIDSEVIDADQEG